MLQVNKQVFKDYGQAAGMVALTLAFLSFCVFQGLSAGANFWLNAWTGDAALLNASTTDPAALRHGNDFYLGIYGLLGVFQCRRTFMSRAGTRLVQAFSCRVSV